MADNRVQKVTSFKDLTDKKDISFTGTGRFCIGLSSNGALAVERDADSLCMVLLELTVHDNGGNTLSPANKDLRCVINSREEVTGEINLVDGTRIEIGDKLLVFINGPIPKTRRKLPPTPGLPLEQKPPAKPSRTTVSLTQDASTKDAGTENMQANCVDDEAMEDRRWLETSWCMLDRPVTEQDMFRDLEAPEQIAILVATYFTKQVRLFTDASVTSQLVDDIFRLFVDTVEHCKDTYMNFLQSISDVLARVPERSHTVPMHGPAVKLLTELLKHCLDPVERVVLVLDLLRTFSHFDHNLPTLVQATAVILGSMAAYQDVLDVQQKGIDILAKIATYSPPVNKKIPLKEAGVLLVTRALKRYNDQLTLCRSACRVLANLSHTFITLINQVLDSDADAAVLEALDKYEAILDYLFKEGLPVAQTALRNFNSDLGVSTEGRKFIFFYAKLPQIQLKKEQWNQQHSITTVSTQDEMVIEGSGETITSMSISPQSSSPVNNNLLTTENIHPEPQGILKRIRSFENLRTSDRRLVFADDTVGGSESDLETSESDFDDIRPPFEGQIPLDLEMENDFSCHLVQHLRKKTIKRRSRHGKADSDTDSSSSDSDVDFLDKIPDKPNRVINTDIPQKPKRVVDTGSAPCDNRDTETQIVDHSRSDSVSIPADSSRETIKEVTEPSLDSGRGTVDSVISVPDVIVTTDSDIQGNCDGEKDKKSYIENSKHSEKEFSRTNGAVIETIQNTDTGDIPPARNRSLSEVMDVYFLGKLTRTQIVIYVGSLVFQGDDSEVLLVIDRPICSLIEASQAPPGLIEFARRQYGPNMTLMDLEPSIVISTIDAVRYKTVTKKFVQSSVLDLTRSINSSLQPTTVTTTMLVVKTLFANSNLQPIVTDEEFLKEFRACFHRATERLEPTGSVEEIRKNLAQSNAVV